jgi:hypothetical protein
LTLSRSLATNPLVPLLLPIRLWPEEATAPEISGPEPVAGLLAMIVSKIVATPPLRLSRPPPLVLGFVVELPAIVLLAT